MTRIILYTSGSVVVLEGVTVDVQSADAEKYKNTIKTDIEFYLQYSSGSSGGASIGECSFLMDNSITIEDGKPCRVQVYGNSIIGKYVLSGGKSVGSTALNLKKNAYYTILGDYTVIYGDIVLNDTATFNIVRGNVSVFGDIYVNDNSSFMCNGKLKLGPGRKIIYHNDSTHPVTATDKNKNIIINGAITYLSNSDESTIRSTLNLDDNDLSNDGVLYNIIDLNDSKSPSKYFYNMSAVNHADSCDALNKFYFDGIKYDISVLTQDNLNCGNWDNMLVFACKNNGTSLHESNKIIMDYTCQNSTIISSRPLYVNETHSVTVSQMGKAEFNYILAHPEIKISGYSVKDFFVDDPNSVVSTIFSTANGGSSSVSTCEKTAANYVKWSKQ